MIRCSCIGDGAECCDVQRGDLAAVIYTFKEFIYDGFMSACGQDSRIPSPGVRILYNTTVKMHAKELCESSPINFM